MLGEGNAESIRQLFVRMQQQERKIFHSIDVDDEGKLRNVLWIHPRSKATNKEFHDVITFDTTYFLTIIRCHL